MTVLRKTQSAGLLWALWAFSSCATAIAADEFDLREYRGKVVVVDFWASWCAPCRRSFPWFNDMHAKYSDEGLVIIGINMDVEESDAQSFLRDYPADFKILYDPDGSIAREFDVIAMPSSYVFDRNGEQAARHLGFQVRKQDQYEALLRETLDRRQ